jgi:hypothetical protein
MTTYNAQTLAAFGYSADELVAARELAAPALPRARPVYNAAKKRFELPRVCQCRMCSGSAALCTLCGRVAYSGPPANTERMCARCGWYCAECVALHPELMVPEEWMFLTCERCNKAHCVYSAGIASPEDGGRRAGGGRAAGGST